MTHDTCIFQVYTLFSQLYVCSKQGTHMHLNPDNLGRYRFLLGFHNSGLSHTSPGCRLKATSGYRRLWAALESCSSEDLSRKTATSAVAEHCNVLGSDLSSGYAARTSWVRQSARTVMTATVPKVCCRQAATGRALPMCWAAAEWSQWFHSSSSQRMSTASAMTTRVEGFRQANCSWASTYIWVYTQAGQHRNLCRNVPVKTHVDKRYTQECCESEEKRVEYAGGDIREMQGNHLCFRIAGYSCHVARCLIWCGGPWCRGAPNCVDFVQDPGFWVCCCCCCWAHWNRGKWEDKVRWGGFPCTRQRYAWVWARSVRM